MKKPVEKVYGEKSLRLNLYLFIAIYLLLYLCVNPVLDVVLLKLFGSNSVYAMEQLNSTKLLSSTIIYTLLGIIPVTFMAWFSYRVIASAKLPPAFHSKIIRFPFTVVIITGRTAKMFGVLTLMVSLILAFQIILHFIETLFLSL